MAGDPAGTPGVPAPDVATLLRDAARTLAQAGVPSPRVDAELLLAHAARAPRSAVQHAALLGSPLARLTAALPDDGHGAGAAGAAGARADAADAVVLARFAASVVRRAAREPLQHLTGVAPFRHLELAVGPGVFVPRPETEVVAQAALDAALAVVAAGRVPVVADLCTGSGALALALATEVPQAVVHAVELDAAAHAWAARNVAALAPGRVHLVRGDARTALRALDGTLDVVVSNPPYVPPDAVPRDPEVARHDPQVALYGLGPDGLEVPRGVAAAAARLLAPGGTFVMEHAEVQARAARAMVRAAGFDHVRTGTDLTGRDRFVVGVAPARSGVQGQVTDLARDARDDVGDCAP